MTKPLLALFVASLAGNVALALFSFGPFAQPTSPRDGPSGTGIASRPPTAVTGNSTAASSAAAKAFTWPNLAPTSDLQAMVSGLRAAGFPRAAITAVLRQILSQRQSANNPMAALPYWRRNNPPKEVMQAQQASYRAMSDEIKTLLGPDQSVDPAERTRRAQRYGDIADAKADALGKIESDYSDMLQLAFNERGGGIVTQEQAALQQKQQRMLEQEKQADIAAVLSPEELAAYNLRNSPSASKLMGNLRNIDVSEQEYTSLYGLQKAFDDANPFENSATSFAQRRAAQAQLDEQVRSVLTGDRFYSYLAQTDYTYVEAQQVTVQFPTVTPEATYDLSKLTQEVQGKLMGTGAAGSPGLSPADRKTLIADYAAQVTTLLGPDATEAYKKSNLGRWMNLPVRRAPPAGGQ